MALLARGLRRAGHHVRLYAAPGSDPSLADVLVEHARLPELSPVAALDPQLPEPAFLRDQHVHTAMMADLLEHQHEVDVVHNHTLHQLPLALSRLLAPPMVTTVHTPPFPWLELGLALADERARLVAVSQALADTWVGAGPRAEVVLNGVDLDACPAGPGGEDLAWVGRLTAEKGADLAVRTARAAGRHLRLAGPVSDPDWYDAVLRPLLGPDVEHVGHLDSTEVARLMGTSAVTLVTPRWDEPYGLVAAESAAVGTPVVGVRRGGLPEVVTSTTGLLVDEGPDLESRLAAAVDVAARLARSDVRRTAQERLGVERMVADYGRVYAELVTS